MKLFASLMLMLMVACGGSNAGRAPDTEPATTNVPVAVDKTPDVTPAQPVAAPVADPATTAELAKRQNQLGLELWKELSKKHGGNLALSPASIGIAFAMTYAGAHGETADLMKKVLHLAGIDPHQSAGAMLASWNAAGKPYQLKVANQLFGEQTMTFVGPFLSLLKQAYGAPIENVDFRNAADPSRVRINKWVSAHTENRINDLLPFGSITEDARLVLVNAIYFKGAWAAKFDAGRTQSGDFHGAAGNKPASFMRQHGVFKYGATADAQVLEMPYVGEDLAMTIVLPKNDLASIEGKLDAAAIDGWVSALRQPDEVEVLLPKFKLETESLSLKEAFKALGMGAAFDDRADFSGMTTEDKLFIADAFHKVFVEVNEEGTEAAAATAVIMNRESARVNPVFNADHPFLFFIRDLKTNAVLFMGRVADPS